MRLDVIHVGIYDICHEIVQKEIQDREMLRLHKMKVNRKYPRIMLKTQRQEKPY